MSSRQDFSGTQSNAFPFTIETAGGAVLGAAVNPALALAMYRMALETHVEHQPVLKRQGEILPLN